jgi:hypothetical protein
LEKETPESPPEQNTISLPRRPIYPAKAVLMEIF